MINIHINNILQITLLDSRKKSLVILETDI